MPSVYAKQGFERHEIMSMIQYEKETGVIHEATNFHPGNEPDPTQTPEPVGAPKELIRSMVDDIRAAAASGPWTGAEKLL